ncbi:MAG: hypothetical protein AAGF28_11765 [Pseudomonadota bacterium]
MAKAGFDRANGLSGDATDVGAEIAPWFSIGDEKGPANIDGYCLKEKGRIREENAPQLGSLREEGG